MLAVLLGLAACSPERAGRTPAPPEPQVSLAANAGPPPVPEPAPAPTPAPTVAAPDEAAVEQRTFRQILVGQIVGAPRRFTWILARTPTRTRLRLICQSGTPVPGHPGISLDGEERAEARWSAPIVTDYAGVPAGETGADTATYRLTVTAGPAGETPCSKVPSVLLLVCRPEGVPVLQAGAVLLVTPRPPHWKPRASERVAALRCDPSAPAEGAPDPGDAPLSPLYRDWPLVFAPSRGGAAGIEWAYENSDMVAQEGAYRWMAASLP
jgi:hypothetical protein